MIRSNKALLITLWIVLSTSPAIAGRLFVDVEMGQGWLSPGGFPSESVACSLVTHVNDFNEIDNTVEFGGRLGFRFTERLEAGFSFTRQNHNHVFSDRYSLRKYDFPTSWYEVFLAYSPWQKGRLRLDVGASAGIVAMDGKSRYSIIEESPLHVGYEGEAFSFSGFTTAELVLAKNASLLMRVGYRQSTITDWDDPDGNMLEFEGYDYEFYFSGIFTRIGLRFYVN